MVLFCLLLNVVPFDQMQCLAIVVVKFRQLEVDIIVYVGHPKANNR